MSHVARVTCEVTNLAALKAACKELGLEFKEGQKTYRWYGQAASMRARTGVNAAGMEYTDQKTSGQCDHAIGLSAADEQASRHGKPYELGVVMNVDGKGYSLVYDNFMQGKGLESKIGKSAELLTQYYAAHVASKQAKKEGWTVQRKWNEATRKVSLICTR